MAEAQEVSVTEKGLSLVCPSDIMYCNPGDDVVLSCHLEPAISAASMEIKWRSKADLVCHYKRGRVTVNRDYEGRVSLSLEDLHNGNVSLTLRDVRRSQRGIYICEVIHERQTMKEYVFLYIRSADFSLVVPTGPVSADPGEDVILPVHLVPETSAVFMEIRWFRGTEFIYEYMNRQRITNNDYENRVSVSIQELRRGNLSLTLKNVDQSDSGDYTCAVFHYGFLKIGVVHLQVREFREKKSDDKLEQLLDDLRKKHDELQQKTNIHEKILKLLQEATDNDGKDRKRKKEKSVGPTPRRSNSTEGIRPFMGEDSTTETTTRRSNSTEGIRPLMGEDSTAETEFTEGPTLRSRRNMDEIPSLMAMEFSGQNTRQTRDVNTSTEQGFSTPVMSSLVLQRERTTVNAIMQTGQERRQESVATEQESSSSSVQSQIQERERPSQSDTSQAGRRTQTPQRPENRTQSPKSTEQNCHIL